jgi:rhodanese-related sulfurtransferase
LQRALKALSLDEVLAAQAAGAQVLDTRDPAEYARAHPAGSIGIGLGGQYATWAGTLLDREKPIVLVAEPGSEQESAMRLGRIGLDNVVGFLNEGMQALEARRDLAEGWDRVVPAVLAEALASDDPPFVLDVRKPAEHEAGRIEGSINIPLNHLRERLSEIPLDQRLMVHCAGGYRSAIAAGILQQAGFARIEELVGGIGSWEAAKFPVVASAA